MRAALQRVALFPRPVGAELLARVYLAPGREAAAGALAGRNRLELQGVLNRLVELRFLRPERQGGGTLYGIHPALRQAVMVKEGREVMAGAAREQLEADLDGIRGRPTTRPTDPAVLDLLEDLVGLCLEPGEREAAFGLYWRRLGRFGHLAGRLGDYARGERLARRLVAATAEGFDRRSHFLLVCELALFVKIQGRLAEAQGWLAANADPKRWPSEPTQVSINHQNLAEARL